MIFAHMYANLISMQDTLAECMINSHITVLVYIHHFHPPVTLPTPTVSSQDNSMWTIALPDDSSVERYIIEFECSIRNITFVEKYMSVNASGGTGRVATSVSCFGGLGQLYRVKVWAVSGPSISHNPAEKVVNIGMS